MNSELATGPDFAETIPSGGYLWWYLDGISDERPVWRDADRLRRQRLLALLTPALSRGAVDPEDHVAINVVLTGRAGAGP